VNVICIDLTKKQACFAINKSGHPCFWGKFHQIPDGFDYPGYPGLAEDNFSS
jgi:hypothetical protein